MKIIRLNTIDSTNSFLKKLARTSTLENMTTVVTENQTSGRGQSSEKWKSKPFKNLTFSTLIHLRDFKVTNQTYLNFAVSLSIFNALVELDIPKVKIKWPNDILSGTKKLCGILIENTIKGGLIHYSVVGIGLNVNQEEFPKELSSASSIKKIIGKEFDLNELLQSILKHLKKTSSLLENKNYEVLEKEYLNNLYKKNTPTMFKNAKSVLFMGIIKGVSSNGKLQIQLENDVIKEFGIKEISFA